MTCAKDLPGCCRVSWWKAVFTPGKNLDGPVLMYKKMCMGRTVPLKIAQLNTQTRNPVVAKNVMTMFRILFTFTSTREFHTERR